MRSSALVAFVLLLAPLVSPGVGASEPPVDVVQGPASWAARVVMDADGSFQATITSCGEKTGSTDGVGAMVLDAAGEMRFGFGVTGHGSPDRTITQLGALDGVEVSYPSWGPICPYSSLTLTVGGAPGSVQHVVMWAAGLDGATSFVVTGSADAIVRRGSAHAAGDPELRSADGANVQVQRRVSGFNGLGVKIIEDASVGVSVAERAWGFWGYNDAKFVCVPGAGCAGPALADQACVLAAGTTCGTSIRWDGPAGGAGGLPGLTLTGEPAGAYTFTVERKVDAYNPGGGAYVPPGVLVFPGENYGFLSLADVSLPS